MATMYAAVNGWRARVSKVWYPTDGSWKADGSSTGINASISDPSGNNKYAVCKIVDLQDSIATDMQELVELKAEIIATIKAVDCIEYQLILEKRYISGKSWPEIAVDLGYKMRHLYKLHDEALAAVKIPEKNSVVQ